MPIRRCPYCKAFIDEGATYCSNCGTKLLFPEDESIAEEIPGDKIIDEEPDTAIPASSKSSDPGLDDEKESKELDKVKDDLLDDQDDLTEEEEELEKDEESEKSDSKKDVPGEDVSSDFDEIDLSEEVEPAEKAEEEESESEEGPLPLSEDKDETGVPEEKDSGEIPNGLSPTGFPEEPLESEIPEKEPLEEQGFNDEDVLPEEEEDDSTADKTDDQMNIFDPVEREREDIERFVDSLKQERKDKIPEPPPLTDELPPWVDNLKEESVPEEDEMEEEKPDLQEDVPSEDIQETLQDSQTDIPDIEIGEEEVPAVKPLFEKNNFENEFKVDETPTWEATEKSYAVESAPEKEPEKSYAVETPIVEASGKSYAVESPREMRTISISQSIMNILIWLKSRVLDLIFITGLWLFSLWIASILIDVSLGNLVRSASAIVFIFYGILFVEYFFLFFFFLGGTLGDRILNPQKE